MERSLSSPPPSGELVEVRIETTLGAHYSFPDMQRAMLEFLLKEDLGLDGNLVLTNVSQAVLVVPVRIIKTLSINGEVKWRGIDSLQELRNPRT
jgi:hypothetical protein